MDLLQSQFALLFVNFSAVCECLRFPPRRSSPSFIFSVSLKLFFLNTFMALKRIKNNNSLHWINLCIYRQRLADTRTHTQSKWVSEWERNTHILCTFSSIILNVPLILRRFVDKFAIFYAAISTLLDYGQFYLRSPYQWHLPIVLHALPYHTVRAKWTTIYASNKI